MRPPAPRKDRRARRSARGEHLLLAGALAILLASLAAPLGAQGPFPAGLGPMPFPPENPPTPEKEMLGKFLFWDEQLSSDDSTACGSCHIPEAGGGDPRAFGPLASHPGFDGIFTTDDDVRGSVGVPRQECDGTPIFDPTFLFDRQVTGRKAPSMIAAGYSAETFWDGRATSAFFDPLDPMGPPVIVAGGALESQAVGPPLSDVEMACVGRDWPSITAKLATVVPLARASDIPAAMIAARTLNPTYPALFTWAFGTPEITPVRIAFAIASYERTLVPDRTPFDLFCNNEPVTLSQQELDGMLLFLDNCTPCHDGIELTDNDFHNIGVRPALEDTGRQQVTGIPGDAGKFKTLGLRNVKLRAPFFHNGGKATLDDVLAFYNGGGDFDDNLDPDIVELNLTNNALLDIKVFLEITLTDPRVEGGLPPFDHPKLQPFFVRGDSNFDSLVDIADVIHALSAIFSGGTIICGDATDANDDGGIDIGDPITVLSRLFSGTPPLPPPSDLAHGPDPTADFLDCVD